MTAARRPCRPPRLCDHALASVAAWLWPPSCAGCGVSLPEGFNALCRACWREILPAHRGRACPRCGRPRARGAAGGACLECRRRRPPWIAARAGAAYAPPLDALAARFKYGGEHGLVAVFARLARRAARDLALSPARVDAVVAVPMDWRRELARPYNAAALIARVVARELRVPLVRGLVRARPGPRQAGLMREERAANAAARFQRGPTSSPRTVVLVDDVWTTGATATACARALKQGGARRVYLVTAARKW